MGRLTSVLLVLFAMTASMVVFQNCAPKAIPAENEAGPAARDSTAADTEYVLSYSRLSRDEAKHLSSDAIIDKIIDEMENVIQYLRVSNGETLAEKLLEKVEALRNNEQLREEVVSRLRSYQLPRATGAKSP